MTLLFIQKNWKTNEIFRARQEMPRYVNDSRQQMENGQRETFWKNNTGAKEMFRQCTVQEYMCVLILDLEKSPTMHNYGHKIPIFPLLYLCI